MFSASQCCEQKCAATKTRPRHFEIIVGYVLGSQREGIVEWVIKPSRPPWFQTLLGLRLGGIRMSYFLHDQEYHTNMDPLLGFYYEHEYMCSPFVSSDRKRYMYF